MPELSFQVESAEAVPFSASPLIAFKLRVTNANAEEHVQTIALRCQIQIEAPQRHYAEGEKARLLDLFGEPQRWGQTLRAMLWTHASVIVSPFQGSTLVELHVPCSFDFNLAATKYFAALEEGEVPLNLMFSGTVFHEDPEAGLQVEQIPWDREAKYRLPVRAWQEMMNIYYPNLAWLALRRDVFDRLHLYKMVRGIPTWEQAIESLLPVVEKADSADSEVEETATSELVQ